MQVGTVDACADISTKKQLAFLMARQGVLPIYEEDAEDMQEGTQVRCAGRGHRLMPACMTLGTNSLKQHGCTPVALPGFGHHPGLPDWGEASVCIALQQCRVQEGSFLFTSFT